MNRCAWWLGLLVAALVEFSPVLGQDGSEAPSAPSEESTTEVQARWQHFVPVPIPPVANDAFPAAASPAPALVELILQPTIFAHARPDLADLRLYDAAGSTIPYSLRYLHPQPMRAPVPANEFNRTEPKDGPHELTLDLERDDIQHNEIQIVTTGQDFRRAVEVDGSEDGKSWRQLVATNLIRFAHGDQKLDVDTLAYADTRFRYVRVRVHPDPNFAAADGNRDNCGISEVRVLHHVDIPGERLTKGATVNPREPVRSFGAPGSAWIIDLGGNNVPCDQIEVDVADSEFARDISVETEFPLGPLGQARFSPVTSTGESVWQRKAGDPKKPLSFQFNEVQTRRLRLQVTDHRNPPLSIRSVSFSAAARQLVFARPAQDVGEIRLYFGNPAAELPNYDFARNLPAKLEPPPVRLVVGEVQLNPDFVPPPQPFTERFPWLIYAVLGSVTTVLAVVILSLSRSAIAIHDASRGP